RAVELKIENSLLGLAGSILEVQGGNKDLGMEMLTPSVVKMSRVTAILNDPGILLRAGKVMHGLVPTRCEVRDSLFVAMPVATLEKPFLALEGVETGEEMLRQFMEWKGEKNAYINMDRMLEVYRPDGMLSLYTQDGDQWKRNEP